MKAEQEEKVQRFNLARKIIGNEEATIFQINRELKIKDLYALSKEDFIKVLKSHAEAQKQKGPNS